MNNIIKSGLYVIATPIGNLQDISLRALEVLAASDIIFCEDTRVTFHLLTAHNIKATLKTYNDYSSVKEREYIKSLVSQGKIVSLVSDAGTPLISDPGYKLIQELKLEKYYVTTIPGASSVLTSLVLSGLPTNEFSFHGFIPNKDVERRKFFLAKKELLHTMIFFETAKRLIQSLTIIKEVFPQRKVVITRELTKKFEEIKEGLAEELIDYYQTNILKGEIVLLISGSYEKTAECFIDELKILLKYTNVKTASLILSELKQINKSLIYKQALQLQQNHE